jgi:hypothetical protein
MNRRDRRAAAKWSKNQSRQAAVREPGKGDTPFELASAASTKDGRPPIPRPMKRNIRKRCGFGCVVCGLPLYEYDHIYGFDGTHREDTITLLCDKHHKEKTNKLLPLAVVEKANTSPFALEQGTTSPYHLHYSGDRCEIGLGNLRFIASIHDMQQVIALGILGLTIVGFTFDQGHLLLTLNLYDRQQNLLASIHENELITTAAAWDVQLVGPRLTVHKGDEEIGMSVLFEPPTRVTIEQGRFFWRTFGFDVSANGVETTPFRHSISGITMHTMHGIIIGKPLPIGTSLFHF